MFWMKDPKTGEKSVTLTMMFIGFAVSLIKLLFAGSVVLGIKFGPFAGTDFTAIFGALAAAYTARKYTDKDKE